MGPLAESLLRSGPQFSQLRHKWHKGCTGTPKAQSKALSLREQTWGQEGEEAGPGAPRKGAP